MKTVSMLAIAAALAVPRTSRADHGAGVSAAVGVGLVGFTDKPMRDAMTAATGRSWQLRTTLRSRSRLAFDLAYVGVRARIASRVDGDRGTVLGTTVEAALRYTLVPAAGWSPYAFAGAGWQRHDVLGMTARRSSDGLDDSGSSVVIPLGLGMAHRSRGGYVVDVGTSFRASHAPLQAWEVGVALGCELP